MPVYQRAQVIFTYDFCSEDPKRIVLKKQMSKGLNPDQQPLDTCYSRDDCHFLEMLEGPFSYDTGHIHLIDDSGV